jgi:hypothetical protein
VISFSKHRFSCAQHRHTGLCLTLNVGVQTYLIKIS